MRKQFTITDSKESPATHTYIIIQSINKKLKELWLVAWTLLLRKPNTKNVQWLQIWIESWRQREKNLKSIKNKKYLFKSVYIIQAGTDFYILLAVWNEMWKRNLFVFEKQEPKIYHLTSHFTIVHFL